MEILSQAHMFKIQNNDCTTELFKFGKSTLLLDICVQSCTINKPTKGACLEPLELLATKTI